MNTGQMDAIVFSYGLVWYSNGQSSTVMQSKAHKEVALTITPCSMSLFLDNQDQLGF